MPLHKLDEAVAATVTPKVELDLNKDLTKEVVDDRM